MGAYGNLFGGHKARNDRDDQSNGQGYDPGGPLDLDSGVVHLAPPVQDRATDDDSTEDEENASDRDDA
ncbi:hypothetical protein GIY23_17915 [Allosaccharopolyspora coralli]|uniref:Uncharacterized protein n=1 Tax=Allosaccharopolyspora coralli TaxID=2665642 RepID=A0A5Q3QD84_9PSEU|nr:hypothetical protein [Allosaccharopolyspora coralli]QGK71144.1 hypothetical protein GIY23_17915 [Allosaccharopolyspora coralli]